MVDIKDKFVSSRVPAKESKILHSDEVRARMRALQQIPRSISACGQYSSSWKCYVILLIAGVLIIRTCFLIHANNYFTLVWCTSSPENTLNFDRGALKMMFTQNIYQK